MSNFRISAFLVNGFNEWQGSVYKYGKFHITRWEKILDFGIIDGAGRKHINISISQSIQHCQKKVQ
jgi:hypothetical protein